MNWCEKMSRMLPSDDGMNLHSTIQPSFLIISYLSRVFHYRVFHYRPSILGYPYFWKHPRGLVHDTFQVVVSNIFYFYAYLGKWSNLTKIFQMGWNHQLVVSRKITIFKTMGSKMPSMGSKVPDMQVAGCKVLGGPKTWASCWVSICFILDLDADFWIVMHIKLVHFW